MINALMQTGILTFIAHTEDAPCLFIILRTQYDARMSTVLQFL